MDDIEAKANAEAVLYDDMAEKVADQLSQRLAWQDIRTPLQRKTDEERAAMRALGDELYAEHMGMVSDPNEMRRNAWRWYAGQALVTFGSSIDACTYADELVKEEESRFGKIGGERERDTLRERVTGLECTCDQLRASCANQRKELHALNVERKATLTKLEDAQQRVAELEAQRELDAGSLRSAINNAQSRLAQVKRLEAQLREAQGAGADEWTADGEAVPTSAVVRHEDANPNWPIGKSDAHVVSTAELTPFEIAAANACDALHVDADGLGFVKREWLDRNRANAQKQRQAMAETKSDADEPITSWSVGKVLHALDRHVSAEALDAMAAKYLRELMTKLDAVTGLAQRWESAAHALGDDHPAARYARELREVLNGKR